MERHRDTHARTQHAWQAGTHARTHTHTHTLSERERERREIERQREEGGRSGARENHEPAPEASAPRLLIRCYPLLLL